MNLQQQASCESSTAVRENGRRGMRESSYAMGEPRPTIGQRGQTQHSQFLVLLLLLGIFCGCLPTQTTGFHFDSSRVWARHARQQTRKQHQGWLVAASGNNRSSKHQPHSDHQNIRKPSTPLDAWKSEWGVQRLSSHSFPFPTTLSALTDQIVTIGLAAVLLEDEEPGARCEQMNPNIVQNALLGDRVLGRRPVRDKHRDAGRIGIEIDGPVNLLYVGILAAIKASQRHQNIPVTLYFESLEATLQARRMLLRIRQMPANAHANIEIRALSDARLPKRKKRKQKSSPSDRSNGIVFVIQPTRNYMTHLQRLAAVATIENIPLILLSPRMTREITSPWDQSGYQRASAYGGEEPPTGPTPWLMRDFWPPVYSWILAEDIGYTHSVLHERQSWDIFECQKSGSAITECDYLASTVNCAGRPTQDLVRKIAIEFTSGSTN